jgi:hypothetical protein
MKTRKRKHIDDLLYKFQEATAKAHKREYIDVAEAIELASRKIFGDDWIKELLPVDDKLIQDYGPKIEPLISEQAFRVGSVGHCPPAYRTRLDRAIGRYLRMNAQRITAYEWLKRNTPAAYFGSYDRDALMAALAKIDQPTPAKPGPGRRPDLAQRVERDVRANLSSGELTLQDFAGMKLKDIAAEYNCKINTASVVKSRILADPNLRKLAKKGI